MSLFAPQLSQILSDEKFSVNDKLTIQKFHDTASSRIQKIFDNENYKKLLIDTIRGLPEDGKNFFYLYLVHKKFNCNGSDNLSTQQAVFLSLAA